MTREGGVGKWGGEEPGEVGEGVCGVGGGVSAMRGEEGLGGGWGGGERELLALTLPQ